VLLLIKIIIKTILQLTVRPKIPIVCLWGGEIQVEFLDIKEPVNLERRSNRSAIWELSKAL
jgi:hypothetical protein